MPQTKPTSEQVTFLQAGTGATQRTALAKLRDTVSVKDFGAVGDGVTDDTAAIQAAINAANLYQLKLQIPGTVNGYKITAPLIIDSLGMCIEGNGEFVTQLIASGNFSEILRFDSNTLYATINGISFVNNSTTTRCVTVNFNATVIRFNKCLFSGSLTGDLLYSNGQNVDVSESTFNLGSANTWAINFDCYNQNCGVTDCRIGGTGNGIKISNTFSPANQVEGLRIADNYFINTGAYNIYIGKSLFTGVTSNVLDQSSSAAIYVFTGAANVVIDGNYIGTGTIGNPFGIYVHEGSGGGHNISNNIIAYQNYGIFVNATVLLRNSFLSITGNNFNNVISNCVVLDSVISASIVGNIDNGFSSGGSWATKNTYGNGSYLFDNNCWSTNAIGLFHVGSYYRFGNDIGVLGRNSGTATPASAVTTFVIAHGLFAIPKTVNFTLEGANLGAIWITGKNSSTFTANWVTASTPIINWQAEV
jgi:hypothetical protein